MTPLAALAGGMAPMLVLPSLEPLAAPEEPGIPLEDPMPEPVVPDVPEEPVDGVEVEGMVAEDPMPEPVVPDVPEEPMEPVDGLVVVEEEPVPEPVVLSVFLLHPPSASAAAKASATAPADLSVGAYMSVPLIKLERLNVSQTSIYLRVPRHRMRRAPKRL